MGIKKITPEERLLNLIKKSGAHPEEMPSMPLPVSRVSETEVAPPSAQARKKYLCFLSVFFFILFSGILFRAFQNNLFPLGYLIREKAEAPAAKTAPPADSESLIPPPQSGAPVFTQKPALEKIAPPSGYALTGVIIGESLSAMIRNTETNENLTLEPGDSLLHYTLTRIEKGKVTFEDSRNTFTLTL